MKEIALSAWNLKYINSKDDSHRKKLFWFQQKCDGFVLQCIIGFNSLYLTCHDFYFWLHGLIYVFRSLVITFWITPLVVVKFTKVSKLFPINSWPLLAFLFLIAAEDLSITRIAGLSWDQWSARLALPLITQLREGSLPLMLPRDLSVSQPTNAMTPGFSCPDCGRMYKLKSSLRNHQKWECGKEPQFQCPYCVYRAKQKMHIGRHMERMHKEKFIKIEEDNKAFNYEQMQMQQQNTSSNGQQ